MLRLSHKDKLNNFAIPDEKYVIKTKTSPDLKIMTYLGNGEFQRDLFGFDVKGFEIKGLSNYKIKPDDTERYIVPLKTILKSKSYKDLMKKEEITKKGKTIYQYNESYSFFLDFIRKSLNKLDKVPAELVEGNDVLSKDFTKKDLAKMQLDLTSKDIKEQYLKQFD